MDDLDRNVWCLLGLPFDAVTMDETIERIHHAVRTREKCFISTPNLNFLIASQKDSDFRDSVINSDLSVADGKPIIWMARLLNIPLPERVAGSDIIERLIENKEGRKPIKVFFFGGQEDVAEQACEKLNAQGKGLQCVGFHNPGFGSIEEMSTPEIINSINQSGADFVIVSLGAKKGQAWIQANKDKLDAPVISHLGAVVNFIAGTVKRAPKIMQKVGLEWVWRIKEEPALWMRYLKDGLAFIRLLLLRVIPYAILLRIVPAALEHNYAMRAQLADEETWVDIFVEGNDPFVTHKSNRAALSDLTTMGKNLQIDFSKVRVLSPEYFGLLLMLKNQLKENGNSLRAYSVSKSLYRQFYWNSIEYILEVDD